MAEVVKIEESAKPDPQYLEIVLKALQYEANLCGVGTKIDVRLSTSELRKEQSERLEKWLHELEDSLSDDSTEPLERENLPGGDSPDER